MVEGTVLTSKITWNKPKLGMSCHRANVAQVNIPVNTGGTISTLGHGSSIFLSGGA